MHYQRTSAAWGYSRRKHGGNTSLVNNLAYFTCHKARKRHWLCPRPPPGSLRDVACKDVIEGATRWEGRLSKGLQRRPGTTRRLGYFFEVSGCRVPWLHPLGLTTPRGTKRTHHGPLQAPKPVTGLTGLHGAFSFLAVSQSP